MKAKPPGATGAMHVVGVFEAKTHFSALIDDAIGGKTTIITKRGKEVARIVPTEDARRERARLAVERIREMRGIIKLEAGEDRRAVIHELINAGRR